MQEQKPTAPEPLPAAGTDVRLMEGVTGGCAGNTDLWYGFSAVSMMNSFDSGNRELAFRPLFLAPLMLPHKKPAQNEAREKNDITQDIRFLLAYSWHLSVQLSGEDTIAGKDAIGRRGNDDDKRIKYFRDCFLKEHRVGSIHMWDNSKAEPSAQCRPGGDLWENMADARKKQESYADPKKYLFYFTQTSNAFDEVRFVYKTIIAYLYKNEPETAKKKLQPLYVELQKKLGKSNRRLRLSEPAAAVLSAAPNTPQKPEEQAYALAELLVISLLLEALERCNENRQNPFEQTQTLYDLFSEIHVSPLSKTEYLLALLKLMKERGISDFHKAEELIAAIREEKDMAFRNDPSTYKWVMYQLYIAVYNASHLTRQQQKRQNALLEAFEAEFPDFEGRLDAETQR